MVYIQRGERHNPAEIRVMDIRSWLSRNCVFAQTAQDPNVPAAPEELPTAPSGRTKKIIQDHLDEQNEPTVQKGRDLILPAGSTLFHGSIEEFEESQLEVGGYDQILWTTDDKYGPAMAQSYIPVSGGSLYTTPKHIQYPSDNPTTQQIQRQLGIFYDYETPGRITWGTGGRADSWPMPKKPDGSQWGFEELSVELVDKMLREHGWEPKDGGSKTSPDWNTYEFRIHDDKILPTGGKATGRLFILKTQQPLKIYNYAGGREGDLMDVDYHKIDLFRSVEQAGYDGIKINDFAQIDNWGNVGHQAIGIFAPSIPKLKWSTIPAQHPTLNKLNDSTPEWDAYQKSQQPPTQAWVRGNCKFAGVMKISAAKLYGWRPKVEETIKEIQNNQLSHSSGPVTVSKLDSIRGGWFVTDGHHRAIEAMMKNENAILCEQNPHIPYLERPAEAYRSYVSDMVPLLPAAQAIKNS